MTLHPLLAWTALAVALVLTPGPDTMLVAGFAARRGFGAALRAALGILVGGMFYMALCGFGFLSVLNAVPALFVVVKVAGAIYLAWLGVNLLIAALRGRDATGDVKGDAGRPSAAAPFRQGFLSTVLNPKVAVVLLAVLPQFVGTGPHAPLFGALLIGMGLIALFYVIGFFWCLVVAAVAARAGRRIGQSAAMRWFEAALGTVFMGLAGRLALARNA